MAKMTRRAMLWATSTGVAALSGAAALVASNKSGHSAEAAAANSTSVTATGSMMVYVANVQKGTLSVSIGDREITVNDPALVRQLLNIAK